MDVVVLVVVAVVMVRAAVPAAIADLFPFVEPSPGHGQSICKLQLENKMFQVSRFFGLPLNVRETM